MITNTAVTASWRRIISCLTLLHLDGADKHVQLTIRWLQGHIDIPEIRNKWAEGPVVKIRIEAPQSVAPGADDAHTGDHDLEQSWT